MNNGAYGSTLKTRDFKRALEINDVLYEITARSYSKSLARGDPDSAEKARKCLARIAEMGVRIKFTESVRRKL